MTPNLLCLNGTKTEFLLLGLRSQLKIIHNRAVTISIVAHLFHPQPLLVTFVLSSRLASPFLIRYPLSLVYVLGYHISDLAAPSLFLPSYTLGPTAHAIGSSLVHSRLDYCNLLYSVSFTTLLSVTCDWIYFNPSGLFCCLVG